MFLGVNKKFHEHNFLEGCKRIGIYGRCYGVEEEGYVVMNELLYGAFSSLT